LSVQSAPERPRILVVMGVSGSGKTTIATRLAGRLDWTFKDADDLHPAANVAKMHAGIPLDDADRAPWLAAVADWIGARLAAGDRAIVACSALKRAYRYTILGGRDSVCFVYLEGGRALLAQRLAGRKGHFMPADLLDSQLATLEPPGPDEPAITVSVDATPEEIVEMIVARLNLEAPRPKP
jgi:gluconokinase